MIRGENGLWNADMELPAGQYEYKLFVDGAWMEDRSCEVEVEIGPVRVVPESEPMVNPWHGQLCFISSLARLWAIRGPARRKE
jgi:hypothetical protein